MASLQFLIQGDQKSALNTISMLHICLTPLGSTWNASLNQNVPSGAAYKAPFCLLEYFLYGFIF